MPEEGLCRGFQGQWLNVQFSGQSGCDWPIRFSKPCNENRETKNSWMLNSKTPQTVMDVMWTEMREAYIYVKQICLPVRVESCYLRDLI